MKTTDKYVFFWSGIYSNWHPSPFQIDGVTYNCSEQYLMAEKARLFGDAEMERRIMSAVDPSDQKRYGRTVQGFDKAKWEAAARAERRSQEGAARNRYAYHRRSLP